jgi:hypothetical protein
MDLRKLGSKHELSRTVRPYDKKGMRIRPMQEDRPNDL